MPKYVVQQGDCVSSIAGSRGLTWEKVWNHPDNAALRQLRRDPNVLYPGDELFVPDKEERLEERPADAKHSFRVKGTSAKIKLRLLDNDEPRANQPYRLEVDGVTVASGTTASDGIVETPISPTAVEAKLHVGADATQSIYTLQLGKLDPVDTAEGIAGRLLCLGYGAENIEEAIGGFQEKYGLAVTGQADEATRQKLQERFGQ